MLQRETSKKAESKISTKPETFKTPKSIGVSKIVESFTPFPKCDGGECYYVDFTIGMEFEGESKSRVIPVHAGGFAQKGASKTQEDVVAAMKLHKTLVGVDPKKVVVILKDDKIAKVFLKEGWEGKTYVPEMILWEEKNK